MLTTQQFDGYLERIRYWDSLAPCKETLCQLHRSQVISIPFENLDIFLKQPILLDPNSLITKLVSEKRGGYCYELNELFLLVLQHLGFTVTSMASRVMLPNGVFRRRSHHMMMVALNERRWLVDVGFGGNVLIEPIPFELDTEFNQTLDIFRIKADRELGFLLQHRLEDNWRTLYAFTLDEVFASDYQTMNDYASHSPNSIFTQERRCIIPTANVRIILRDFKLKIRGINEINVTYLQDETAYRDVLKKHFGIEFLPEQIRALLARS